MYRPIIKKPISFLAFLSSRSIAISFLIFSLHCLGNQRFLLEIESPSPLSIKQYIITNTLNKLFDY